MLDYNYQHWTIDRHWTHRLYVLIAIPQSEGFIRVKALTFGRAIPRDDHALAGGVASHPSRPASSLPFIEM